MNEGNCKMACNAVPKANRDQESWVKARILSAIRMAKAVEREQHVLADSVLTESAIDGIANGAAIEVIHSLGLGCSYVNLRPTESGGIAKALASERKAD